MKISKDEYFQWAKAQKKKDGAERADGSVVKSAETVIAGTAETAQPQAAAESGCSKKIEKNARRKKHCNGRSDLPPLKKQILVKCSEEEHALIFEAAAALGLTPNRFLVAAALKATSELLRSRDLYAEVMMEQMIAKCLRLGREQPSDQTGFGVV